MKKTKTLKNTIISGYILVVLAPILVIGIFVLSILTSELEKDVNRRNKTLSQALAAEAEIFLQEPKNLLRQIRMIFNKHILNSETSRQNYLEILLKSYPFFESIQVIDKTGKVKLQVPFSRALAGIDVSGQDFYQILVRVPDFYISASFISNLTGNPTLTLTTPVTNGMITAYLSLNYLNRLINRFSSDKATKFGIIDQRGNYIAFTNPRYVSQRNNIKHLNLVRQAMEGKYTSGYIRYMNQDMLVNASPVEGTRWTAVVFHPEKTAFQIIRTSRNIFLIGALLALAIALLIGFWNLRIVLPPLAHLKIQSHRIASGDYYYTPKHEKFKEIRDLSRDFHKMALEIQKRENELIKLNHTLSAVIQASPVAIVALDLKGNIIMWNPSAERMFGWSEEEALNQKLLTVPPELADEHRYLIREAAGGNLYPGYETKRMRKDGSIFDVSIWSAFLENEKGERDSFLAMIMDISHKKKAQQALMENMEFLEITLNSIGDAVITTDIESRVLQMNPIAEKLTGWSIEEAKFKPLESVFHIINAVTEEQMESPVKKVIEKGVIQGLANNTALISRTGETYQIADSAAPIRKSSGEILGAVLVFRDVTEKYIADAKIKASLMEKEVLLREVHHRVKNNLQILYSLLILQEDSVQDKAALKVLQDSQSRVQSMALIHKKLYQAEDLRNINLREYTEELVGELASTYARQNQNISIEIDAEPVPVNVDTAIPCGLILNELISNALKYAFPDNRTGKVEIRIVSYDQEILLVVRDNGVGFPDKVHYDKVSESIGLNLVETLSQQLNGTVIFKQSNGTEVTVRFPFPSV